MRYPRSSRSPVSGGNILHKSHLCRPYPVRQLPWHVAHSKTRREVRFFYPPRHPMRLIDTKAKILYPRQQHHAVPSQQSFANVGQHFTREPYVHPVARPSTSMAHHPRRMSLILRADPESCMSQARTSSWLSQRRTRTPRSTAPIIRSSSARARARDRRYFNAYPDIRRVLRVSPGYGSSLVRVWISKRLSYRSPTLLRLIIIPRRPTPKTTSAAPTKSEI